MTRAGDPDDPPAADAPWTLTVTREDGTVEISTIEPPEPTNEPFNHDGFWKAALVAPEDGRLCCVPLLAITAEIVEAPPHLFIWLNDTPVECKDVPGFICAMGTELDEATVCRDVARDYAEAIEAWRDAFARARTG